MEDDDSIERAREAKRGSPFLSPKQAAHYLGVEASAMYGVAALFASAFWVANQSFVLAWTPWLFRKLKAAPTEGLREVISVSILYFVLAAIAAGDDSGEAAGAEIINVTREGTQCSSFEECAQLLKDGEGIDYEGVSGPTDMNDTGSPASGTIGIQLYDGNKYSQIDAVSGVVN